MKITSALVRIYGGTELLNLAASKGYMKLFEKLVSNGYRTDEFTLPSAFHGNNVHLIRKLVSLAGPADHTDMYGLGYTPLSLAINEQRKEFIDIVRDEGAFNYLHAWPAFKPAWKAAVLARNDEILQELFPLHPNLPISYLENMFECASRTGNYDLAKGLLDRGINVGANTIISALEHGRTDLFELFIDSGVNDYELNVVLRTVLSPEPTESLREGAHPTVHALDCALRARNENLADILIDAGVGVVRALRVTASMGDNDMTKYVLRRGADPNNPEALETAYHENQTVFNTILTAYRNRYARRMRNFGSSVLCLAIKNQDMPLIEKLLESNADPHGFVIGDIPYVTPFGRAIVADNTVDLVMVKQFLKYGCCATDVVSRLDRSAVSDPTPRTTAFLTAITTENIELVKLLLQNDETIIRAPARGSFKRTALQRAAEVGSFKMVELIHNLGADINEPPNRICGATALQLAAMGGFGKILCYLIRHGADVNARGAVIDGMTALVGAAASRRIDIVAILLQEGAGHGEGGSEQREDAIREAEQNGYSCTGDYIREMWSFQGQEGPSQELDPIEMFMDFDDEY
ncbi:ankyrin repeat-containing domain protein [Xylaria sp. FL1042]|nr:ankyrin repeat-containing domain protein [Xylaria sp. FL1042]